MQQKVKDRVRGFDDAILLAVNLQLTTEIAGGVVGGKRRVGAGDDVMT